MKLEKVSKIRKKKKISARENVDVDLELRGDCLKKESVE